MRALLAKGREFLTSAKANLERGRYEVACFEADQATQLSLKAYAQKLSGSIPRTHSIRSLLADLASLTNTEKQVTRFIAKRRAELIAVEDAYIRARYAVDRYAKEDAKLCIKSAEEVIKLAKEISKSG